MTNYYTSTLIKELRTSYGYTIQKVANTLGVSKAAVSKWENGDDIGTEHLYDLAKLYNVTFSELYEGKLKNEDNSAYWRRNYDLSNFALEEDITNKNVDNLKILFEHCVMVKNRFLELLPRWASNKLSNNELEEFSFIKKYFEFDTQYYAYVLYGPRHLAFADESKEKEFVIDTINKISKESKESQLWEFKKLYTFKYDYKSDAICKSGNLKALEYMMSSFDQIEKDSILYANLHIEEEVEEESFSFIGEPKTTKVKKERDRTLEEIEVIPFFKVMLNNGANVLYRYKSFNNGWDREMLDHIDGKIIKLDASIYDKHQFCNFGGKTYIPILSGWKAYTYDDYLEFIDKDTTEFYKDIVNLKDSNPIKYFENFERREGIDGK
ncbi:MAG: helix-turn-helix transcriptional regulator [Bacilli bacterium]|nr:helix-turn-helix transcriptional regulator [Bacilli bacterium]